MAKKLNLKNNSISACLEFQYREDAERFYWNIPGGSDKVSASLTGTRIMLDSERDRKLMLRICKMIENASNGRIAGANRYTKAYGTCTVVHQDMYRVSRG